MCLNLHKRLTINNIHFKCNVKGEENILFPIVFHYWKGRSWFKFIVFPEVWIFDHNLKLFSTVFRNSGDFIRKAKLNETSTWEPLEISLNILAQNEWIEADLKIILWQKEQFFLVFICFVLNTITWILY